MMKDKLIDGEISADLVEDGAMLFIKRYTLPGIGIPVLEYSKACYIGLIMLMNRTFLHGVGKTTKNIRKHPGAKPKINTQVLKLYGKEKN